MRSAIAPEIRAGVMMANLPWNMAYTREGMPRFSPFTVISMMVESIPLNST